MVNVRLKQRIMAQALQLLFPIDIRGNSQVKDLVDRLKKPEPVLGSLEDLYFSTYKIEDTGAYGIVPHVRLLLGITNGVFVSGIIDRGYEPKDFGYKRLSSLEAAIVDYLTEQGIPLKHL